MAASLRHSVCNLARILAIGLAIFGWHEAVARIPMQMELRPEGLFEKNLGQFEPAASYRTRIGPLRATVQRDGSLAVFSSSAAEPVRIAHIASAPAREIEAPAPAAYRTHYFRAGEQPIVDVPHFERLRVRDLYPGIDVIYHSRGGFLEFDYEVAPGRDPGRIATRVAGALSSRIDAQGDLLIEVPNGIVRQRKPIAYQLREGVRAPVECEYRLEGGSVKLAVGDYDRRYALVIDPVVEYSSYLGGSNGDKITGVAIGPGGYLYVVGSTESTDFPVVNAYDPTLGGTSDAFVAKINPVTGKADFATYVGGSNPDYGMALAVGSDGAIYFTGLPASRFPTTSGAYQTSASGTYGFVTKLSSTGNTLVYSTFVAGTKPRSIAVDPSGRAVITGSAGTAFLATAGAYQTAFGGFALPSGAEGDAFALMLNASGSGAVFATFIGGSDIDEGRGIALDAAGKVVIGGVTQSTNFAASGGFQAALRGTNDGFVVTLAADGRTRVAGTYFGGTDMDEINGLALDPFGNVVVVGNTRSADLPTPNAVMPWTSLSLNYQTGFSPPYTLYNRKGFLAKLAPSLASLAFATYTGGAINCCDSADSVAVDGAGDIYMGGFSRVDQFNKFTALRPYIDTLLVRSKYSSTYEGEATYAAAYSRDGSSLKFQSYVAGCDFTNFQNSTTCQPVFLAATAPGQVLVGGSTLVNWIPIAAANTQPTHKNPDLRTTGFLTRLSFEPLSTLLISSSNSAPVGGATVTLTVTSYAAGASGSVTFWDDTSQIGSASFVDGIAKLNIALAPGVRKLSAKWNSTTSPTLLLPVVLP